MRLALTLLGLDLLTIEISTDEAGSEDAGEATSYPVGFTASHGDQRWEQGVEQ